MVLAVCSVKSQPLTEKFPPLKQIYDYWKERSFPYVHIYCDTFFYADRIDSRVIDDVEDMLSPDTVIIHQLGTKSMAKESPIYLSKDEKEDLLERLEALKEQKWPQDLFPLSRLVAGEDVAERVRQTARQGTKLESKLCKSINVFPFPCFSVMKNYVFSTLNKMMS